MATFQITDGASDTVDLLDSSNFEVVRLPDNVIRGGIAPNRRQFEVVLKLNSQADHDAAASDFQSLNKLLWRAVLFNNSGWEESHIYLQQQSETETNARYSLITNVIETPEPGILDYIFKQHNEIVEASWTIEREHPWRNNAPGTLGSAVTLTATAGPASPTLAQVSNFRDDGDLSHVFHFDDSTSTFSSNLLSASANTELFPSSPAANDILYVGATDIAFKNATFGILTAGSFNWDIKWQYYNGSAWTDMALGTDYTLWGEDAGDIADDDTLFTTVGQWAINVFPPSDWAKTTINSQNAYWIRALLVTVTSTTTVPEKDADDIYAQNDSHIEIPAASLGGDSPPIYNLRLHSPAGGDENPGPASLTNIIVGAKSRGLTNFTPFLNAGGNDNPAEWTVTQGTDGSSTSDTQAPGGAHSAVDFATDTTFVNRVELLGDNILDDWLGEYKVFLRVQQIGGSAGDINCKVRTYLGGTATSDPYLDSNEQETTGADQGPEVLDLGFLSLPFIRAFNSDSSNIDVIFQVFAERTTGSATLRIYDLILMPLDEGAVGLLDFAVDAENGSNALRGGSVLDVDTGVIANRTVKYWHDGTNLNPVAAWGRENEPPSLANVGTKTRLYFLFLHDATGNENWGEEPLVANLGCNLAAELFVHERFSVLRGSS